MRSSPLFAAALVLPSAATRSDPTNAPDDAAATGAPFDQLDAHGDGDLSRAEASAVQPIADIYDAMDTNATFEKQARHGNAGIGYAQFKAGIGAARSSGAFGPSVSGGPTYLLSPDDYRVRVDPSLDSDAGNDDATHN